MTPLTDALTLGLDLGTTGCKAVALSSAGKVLGLKSATYPLLTDRSGRAEQDPHAIWRAVCQSLKELSGWLSEQGLPRPAGMALGGAMHSILPLGKDAEPLGNATTWADSRAKKVVPDDLAAARRLYEATGCPLQTPYHPARLRWFRAAQPELFSRAHTFVSLKDYVAYRLTGTLATDVGMASTTGLLDIHKVRWFDDALALAGISAAALPELIGATDRLSTLTSGAAAATGLTAGLPIFAGSSDGGLANLGSGVVRPGETVVTVGTSGAVRQVAPAPQLGPEGLTWCYLLTGGYYFAGGAINNGGLALEWLRATLYSELPQAEGFEQLLKDAAGAKPSNIICLPYLTGERTPHWDASLRASMFGVGRYHTRADLARAGLEGVAFSLADVYELLKPNALPVQLAGGVTRSPFWAQLLTDVLGTKTELNPVADASGIGAALFAQVALGWVNLEEAAQLVSEGARTELTPDPKNHARLNEKRAQAQALLKATRDLS